LFQECASFAQPVADTGDGRAIEERMVELKLPGHLAPVLANGRLVFAGGGAPMYDEGTPWYVQVFWLQDALLPLMCPIDSVGLHDANCAVLAVMAGPWRETFAAGVRLAAEPPGLGKMVFESRWAAFNDTYRANVGGALVFADGRLVQRRAWDEDLAVFPYDSEALAVPMRWNIPIGGLHLVQIGPALRDRLQLHQWLSARVRETLGLAPGPAGEAVPTPRPFAHSIAHCAVTAARLTREADAVRADLLTAGGNAIETWVWRWADGRLSSATCTRVRGVVPFYDGVRDASTKGETKDWYKGVPVPRMEQEFRFGAVVGMPDAVVPVSMTVVCEDEQFACDLRYFDYQVNMGLPEGCFGYDVPAAGGAE